MPSEPMTRAQALAAAAQNDGRELDEPDFEPDEEPNDEPEITTAKAPITVERVAHLLDCVTVLRTLTPIATFLDHSNAWAELLRDDCPADLLYQIAGACKLHECEIGLETSVLQGGVPRLVIHPVEE